VGRTRDQGTWSRCLLRRGSLVIAYFLTDNSPIPGPVYSVANKVGLIFLPFHEMEPFVDLLRNEKPVTAYLNSDSPQWNQLFTGKEPVGEAE